MGWSGECRIWPLAGLWSCLISEGEEGVKIRPAEALVFIQPRVSGTCRWPHSPRSALVLCRALGQCWRRLRDESSVAPFGEGAKCCLFEILAAYFCVDLGCLQAHGTFELKKKPSPSIHTVLLGKGCSFNRDRNAEFRILCWFPPLLCV